VVLFLFAAVHTILVCEVCVSYFVSTNKLANKQTGTNDHATPCCACAHTG